MPEEATDLRLVPAALVAWVCAAAAVAWGWRPALVAAGVLAAAAALAGTVGRRRYRRAPGFRRGRGARGAGSWTACVLLAAGAGAVVLASASAQIALRELGPLAHLVDEQAVVEVTGTVRSEVVPAPAAWAGQSELEAAERGEPVSRYRTVLAVEEVSGRGVTGGAAADLRVEGGGAWRGIPYGARVRVTGRLGPAEPGRSEVGMLTSNDGVLLVERPGPVDRAVAAVREGLLRATAGLPRDARGLVPGAAVGDTTRVPADLADAMRAVGLTHLTAVSGGHFAVLSLAVLTLTSVLRAPRWARAAATAIASAGFVILVHPEPSVVRAAVMGAVGVWGIVAGRPARAAPALCAAVIVLVMVDPWLSLALGFVLSVVATAAIVLLAPSLARAFGYLPRWLALGAAVSLAAQVACAPVTLLLQPTVSLYAVPANLLVAPAVMPATLLGLASALTAPWVPGLATYLAQGAAGATWWISTVARRGAALPGATIPWPPGVAGIVGLAALEALGVLALLHGPAVVRMCRSRSPAP